ncbi:hypothetical protein NQ317_017728 [Molorchus minor]|uniref:Uncharacterized protein n=1 Tax=Molorchus minor TaxID=1323400 RepID=A0ABQ9IXC4_9CUCU|nr:hypothetical protein NQ317_017728 [Molorchus minor]
MKITDQTRVPNPRMAIGGSIPQQIKRTGVGIENQETELSPCLKINRNPPRPDEPFSWKTLDIFSGGPFWQ